MEIPSRQLSHIEWLGGGCRDTTMATPSPALSSIWPALPSISWSVWNLPLTFVNGDTGTFEHEGTLRAIEQKGSGIGGVHERALHASWTCYGRARQLGEGYVLPDSEVKGTYC